MSRFEIMDDPRIRDAEMYGLPEASEVRCPICGKEADSFYLDSEGDIFACDRCLKSVDAFDYADRHGWFDPQA